MQQPNAQQQPQQSNAQPQPPKKQKPKTSIALKAQHFQSAKGIRALYQKTKSLNLGEDADINIERTMKKIMVALRSWHFEMMPKYSFEYFLQRTQVLGTQGLLSAYMSKVRRIHKGLDQWEQPEARPAQQQAQQGQREQRQQRADRVPLGNIQNMGMEQQLRMLDEVPAVMAMDQSEDQDQKLLRMMQKLQQNTGKKSQAKEQQYNQYVPEGFDIDFDDDYE